MQNFKKGDLLKIECAILYSSSIKASSYFGNPSNFNAIFLKDLGKTKFATNEIKVLYLKNLKTYYCSIGTTRIKKL